MKKSSGGATIKLYFPEKNHKFPQIWQSKQHAKFNTKDL